MIDFCFKTFSTTSYPTTSRVILCLSTFHDNEDIEKNVNGKG